MKKKIQVFVSSTYIDLLEERQAAVEAIREAGHIPAGMELFTADDKSQWEVIKEWIDESDVFLLILGGRYGSIDLNSGKSYTHLEYEYAQKIKKPYFALVIKDPDDKKRVNRLGVNTAIERDNPKDYTSFRNLVQSKIVMYWGDTRDIKYDIMKKMNEYEHREDIVGWVRADTTQTSSEVAEQLARLIQDRDSLQKKYDDIKREMKEKKPDIKVFFNTNTSDWQPTTNLEMNLENISIKGAINKYTETSQISNGLSSIASLNNSLINRHEVNENFYRDIARYYSANKKTIQIGFSLTNTGTLSCKNVRLEVLIPDDNNSIRFLKNTPKRPWKSRTVPVFPNIAGFHSYHETSLVERLQEKPPCLLEHKRQGDDWLLHTNFENIRPQETVSHDNWIIMSFSDSTHITCTATLLSDNLSSPITLPLEINIMVDKKEYSVLDLENIWKKEKAAELIKLKTQPEAECDDID